MVFCIQSFLPSPLLLFPAELFSSLLQLYLTSLLISFLPHLYYYIILPFHSPVHCHSFYYFTALFYLRYFLYHIFPIFDLLFFLTLCFDSLFIVTTPGGVISHWCWLYLIWLLHHTKKKIHIIAWKRWRRKRKNKIRNVLLGGWL